MTDEQIESLRGSLQVLRDLTEAILGSLPPAPMPLDRCARCGWTYSESWERGCVRGNCAYRGDDLKAPRDPERYAREQAESIRKPEPEPSWFPAWARQGREVQAADGTPGIVTGIVGRSASVSWKKRAPIAYPPQEFTGPHGIRPKP